MREGYDARIITVHTMYVADTYLDGMSGATVCANSLGREYCHRNHAFEQED
jgi:hypothetical protein